MLYSFNADALFLGDVSATNFAKDATALMLGGLLAMPTEPFDTSATAKPTVFALRLKRVEAAEAVSDGESAALLAEALAAALLSELGLLLLGWSGHSVTATVGAAVILPQFLSR